MQTVVFFAFLAMANAGVILPKTRTTIAGPSGTIIKEEGLPVIEEHAVVNSIPIVPEQPIVEIARSAELEFPLVHQQPPVEVAHPELEYPLLNEELPFINQHVPLVPSIISNPVFYRKNYGFESLPFVRSLGLERTYTRKLPYHYYGANLFGGTLRNF